MARTIKLKESDLTKIVRRISESKRLLMEKWRMDWALLKKDIKAIIGWINIGSTIWGWFSDSRLKKNIRRVGKSPSGIPIYEFEYKNKVRFGGGTYRGVLAEHAPKRAVTIAENGYRKVNYSKIDVAFEKVNPTKKIRLSESDLTRVIRRVVSEQQMHAGDGWLDDLGGGGPRGPKNPFDTPDWFAGSQEGGGSDDPMARGNEEMETRGGTDGSDPRNHPQWQEFVRVGQAGSAALKSVAQEGGLPIADDILRLAESMDIAITNPESMSQQDIEDLLPSAKGIIKWLRDRYKKCACGTNPETYDQGCCNKD
jgi:hypothetical protein